MSEKSKSNPILKHLLNIKNGKTPGVVTYLFKDGTKQTQSINNQVFYDEKGKDLALYKVIQMFNTIAHDLGAYRFNLN